MSAPRTSVAGKLREQLGSEPFLREVASHGGPTGAAKRYGGKPTTWEHNIAEARMETGKDWRDFVGQGSADESAIAEPMPGNVTEGELQAQYETEVDRASGRKLPVEKSDVKAVEQAARLIDDDPYSPKPKGKLDLPPSAFEESIPRVFGGGLVGGAARRPGEDGAGSDWFGYYMEATDVRERIHAVRLKCAPGKPYATLLPISDVHIGPVGCAFREIAATLTWAATKDGLYPFTLGDCLNNATLNSVEGMNLGAQLLDIMPSAAVMTQLFRPIADAGRLLVLADGNHEARWVRQLGQNVSPTQFVAERLNVPYSSSSFPMIVQVGDQTYTLYIHHGTGSGQSYGHLWNTMQRFTENNKCDAAIAGHRHVRGNQERAVMAASQDDNGVWWWSPSGIQMIAIGCWLRYVPGSYARDRNMPPAVLGTNLVRLYADKHLVQPLPFGMPKIGGA